MFYSAISNHEWDRHEKEYLNDNPYVSIEEQLNWNRVGFAGKPNTTKKVIKNR